MDNEAILIEDCVHRIVDPNKLKFIKKNHFIIDSLRKVVPLQVSNFYGRNFDLDFQTPHFNQAFFYLLRVHLLWIQMIMYQLISIMMYRYIIISRYFGKKSFNSMKTGYNLIGDSMKPTPGFFLFDWLQEHLDIGKIKAG